MQRNKFVLVILIFMIAFSTIFSFNVSKASTVMIDGVALTKEEAKEKLQNLQTKNGFEMTLSELALSLGDMIMDYSAFLFKDELTIDRIVFNKVLTLNPNFFYFNKAGLVPDTTEILCDIINMWYTFFKGLAIVVYLVILIAIGMKVMLGQANSKAKAHDLIVKWTLGVAILFLFPYVMKFSFRMNEALVNSARANFTNNNPYEEITGNYIGKISEVQFDKVFEWRSPEYISQNEYIYSIGSEEATFSYFKNVEKYQQRGDVMRIMRALAGITGRFIYVILWYIMLWQLLVLIFIYLKRYLIIVFLIIIFPLVVIAQVIGDVVSGKGGSFSAWCSEFFLNVFIQTIHAFTYGVIGGVVTANVQNGMMNNNISKMNWVLLIIAVNFMFEADGIIKKIIKANATTQDNSADMADKIRGLRGIKGKFGL